MHLLYRAFDCNQHRAANFSLIIILLSLHECPSSCPPPNRAAQSPGQAFCKDLGTVAAHAIAAQVQMQLSQ